MPRRTHEANRDRSSRATHSERDQDRARETHADAEQRPTITDEGLGLSPSQRPTTDEERRLFGLSDPDGGITDFDPGGQRTGDIATAATPSGEAEVIDEEPDLTTSPHQLADADATVPDLEPSLMDQDLLTDPTAAPGSSTSRDPAAEGNVAYVPPMDPVVQPGEDADVTVLGGFSTSSPEEIVPRRSASDGRIGDEALVDAVQSALRHDAATTDLTIEVVVERGIVRLRGTVPGLEDVDNAEAVAGRVEGVVDVIEELQVEEL